MSIYTGRTQVPYYYSCYGYTRGNGKTWHGGIDLVGLDSTTILMPDYSGKSISGTVVSSRKVDKSTGDLTWEWGWYVCVQLDANQTPDAVNLSLGSGNAGFTTPDAKYQSILDKLAETDTVVSISAGNSSSWPENSVNGTGALYLDDVNLSLIHI